jgi:hypothetical protein
MSELKSWVWPDISSRRQIHFAILEGFLAAIAAAALFVFSAILTHISTYEADLLSIVVELAYVALFVGMAFGIERRSRAAAVIALSVYLLNFLLTAIQHGPRGIIATALISVALVNAVRGTFAYHKLPVPPPGTPSLEKTFEVFRRVPIPPDLSPPK